MRGGRAGDKKRRAICKSITGLRCSQQGEEHGSPAHDPCMRVVTSRGNPVHQPREPSPPARSHSSQSVRHVGHDLAQVAAGAQLPVHHAARVVVEAQEVAPGAAARLLVMHTRKDPAQHGGAGGRNDGWEDDQEKQ